MRLIDADLFVQKVTKHFTQPNYHPDADAFIAMEAEQHNNYIQGFIEDIESQPTVNEWIPCREILPSKTDEYLCTVEWYGTSTKKLLISNGYNIEKRIMLVHFLDSTKTFKEIDNFCTYKVIA